MSATPGALPGKRIGMGKGTDRSSDITLLFSCVGRRVELLQAFRAAASRLGVSLRLIGTDITPTAPALACVDEAHLTPKIADPSYVSALMQIVRDSRADAIVPTIDTDLPILAESASAIAAAGCRPLVAAPEVVRICFDKLETHRFLSSHGIDTPATHLPDERRFSPTPAQRCFIKPRHGSASVGAHVVSSAAELEFLLARVEEPILQEYLEGEVYTLDVYTGLTGRPRCVVPRRRLQVRGGEVTRGVVVKDAEIMSAGRRVAEALGPSALGMITLQCIVTAQRRICFIDINPRFGGGAPMGIAAGADYPGWLLRELRGERFEIAFDGFRHGLCMLRYDWSVFTQLDADAEPTLRPPLTRFPSFEIPGEHAGGRT